MSTSSAAATFGNRKIPRVSLDSVQARAVDAILAHRAAGHASGLVVMPTGTGKTRTAIKVSRRMVGESRWGMFVAHTDELVDQAAKSFRGMGMPVLIEKAEQHALRDAIQIRGGVTFGQDRETRMVVAGKDTLQGKRLATWPRDFFDFVHLDEAHRSTSATWRNVREHFAPAYCQGWTATPQRTDGKNLGAVFEPSEAHPKGFVFEYSLKDAVTNGHLVRLEERICQTSVDLRDLRTSRSDGDFNKGDLEDRINKSLRILANAVADEFGRLGITYGIVFTPQVLSAEAFALALTKLGIPAKHVHGEHPDRWAIVQGFREREYRVLCNADVLIEGADFPHAGACVIARPTKSQLRFAQMVGRVCRLSPDTGKEVGYILQPAWIGADLGLVSTADLFAGDEVPDAVRARAKELLEDGDTADPLEALDVAAEIEERKRAREAAEARRRLRVDIDRRRVHCDVLVRDPVFAALGFKPKVMAGSELPADVHLQASLVMLGVPAAEASSFTRGEAEGLRRTLWKRDRARLATFGQVRRLVAELSFTEASAAALSARTAADLLHMQARDIYRAS